MLAAAIVVINIDCVRAAEYTDTEHWAKNHINYVTEKGYFAGVSDTEFSPDSEMTRGMFVTVLARYECVDLDNYDLLPFSDVAEEQYYTKPVIWAAENNIVEGITKTCFDPNAPITREQVATILYRYLGFEDATLSPAYDDWEHISGWAKDAVASTTQHNLFVGYDNKFNPKGNITRAECAVLFSRMDGKMFDLYEVPKEKLTYIGTYKLTYYCAGCSSSMTAIGKRATSNHTVALPRNMWSQWSYYVGKIIYIENVGYRVIEDKCGTNAFDIFCDGGCGSQPFNVTRQKIYLVEQEIGYENVFCRRQLSA